MSAPATITEFIELGCKAGLLEEKRAAEYRRQLEARPALPSTPEEIAQEMVRDGLLTTFQTRQLLAGKWRGFLLGKKYRLLDCIGSGGMGSVYLCEHLLLRRQVAIKILPKGLAADPVVLQRFYREARAVAALSHPNIVRAHDVGHDDELHFLIMEYVDGASLQDIIKNHGPMDLTRAIHYIAQAATGLQHAHEQGLVHRDVKPANLLLDRQGTIKVLDLGLARFFHDDQDQLTDRHDAGAVLGTADYLAPEQAIESHSVDIRADIYALGATFYFLLAGHAPFHDKNMAQKIACHQLKEPKPIQEIREGVPEDIAKILSRMMAKNAADRFQEPTEITQALMPWTQTPIDPPPPAEMPNVAAQSAAEPDYKETPRPEESGIRESATVIPPAHASNQPTDLLSDLAGPSAQSSPLIETKHSFEMTAPNFTVPHRSFSWSRKAGLVVAATALVSLVMVVSVLAFFGHLFSSSPRLPDAPFPAAPTKDKLSAYEPAVSPIGMTRNLINAHDGPVGTIRFSRNGQRLITLGAGGDISVWNTTSGKPLFRLLGDMEAANDAVFTPQEDRIITAGRDGAIRVWQSASGKLLRTLKAGVKPLHRLVVSNGGQFITASADGEMNAWDLKSWKKSHSFQCKSIQCISVCPGGRQIITGGKFGEVILWQSDNKQPIHRFKSHQGAVYSVATSSDGRHAASAGDDKVIKLWDLYKKQAVREFRGHSKAVTSITFSESGRHLISAGEDGTMRVWDVATARLVYQSEQPNKPIQRIACSPDGRLFAVGFRNGKIAIVNAPTFLYSIPAGLVCRFVNPQGAANTVAISKDGRFSASAGADKTVRLWDLVELKEIRQFKGHKAAISSVLFAKDGQEIFSAGADRIIFKWDAATGAKLQTYKGHAGSIFGIKLSFDGRQLLSASADGTARLWDVFNGRQIRQFRVSGKTVHSADWSFDRKRIGTLSSDNLIRFWDAAKGKELRKISIQPLSAQQLLVAGKDSFVTAGGLPVVCLWKLNGTAKPACQQLSGHRGNVNGVALTRGGRLGLTAGDGGKLILWDLKRQSAIRVFAGQHGAVKSVAVSADGTSAVSGDAEGNVSFWRLPDCAHTPFVGNAAIFAVEGKPVTCLALSPEGHHAAAGDSEGGLFVHDAESGKIVAQLPGHKSTVTGCRFSADGKYLLSSSDDWSFRLWRVGTGKLVQAFDGHEGKVRAAEFSPDGVRFLSAGTDDSIRLWDGISGEQLMRYKGHTGDVNAALFLPSGNKILSVSSDKTIRLWNVESGKLLSTQKAHNAVLTSLAVAPGGAFALTGGEDNVLCLWDLNKLKLAFKFKGHTKTIRCIAVSPDGQYALTGSDDATVRYWDINKRRLIGSFKHHGFSVTGVDFTPDGRHAVSSSLDRTLRRWALPVPQPW